jgi:mannosyltransferase OCH1-like enzyme
MNNNHYFIEALFAHGDENKKIKVSDFDIPMNKLSPLDISEDNDLRSRYIWNLIQTCKSEISEDTTSAIPRILVQFWDDAKTIPADVRKCMDSWYPLDEYGFQRLVFDDESARDFITSNFDHRYLDAFEHCRHPAMRSDYFRMCYIYRKGGFYVDADDVYKGFDIESLFNNEKLKIQPLCYNIEADLMVNTAEFITNCKYSSNLIHYVNNDPIISPPNHPIIRMALERSTRILLALGSNAKDIQSTTGPGNLTASIVRHAIESKYAGKAQDFLLIDNWDDVSVPQWPLEYRRDKRNWRIWDGTDI